ncbi:MAG: 4-hydroxybenzoyl-CoA reductase, partial [Actinomycetia bacterium]|nr:4-hydroxybenzoyl-CoA reductase [Actinomycetes bacterium]
MTLRIPPFDLAEPETLAEAVNLLSDPTAIVLGGGTDVVPKMKRRQATPATLVSLAGIDGLNGIWPSDDGGCVVGASTPLVELAESIDVHPALAAAASSIASPQIRNTATVGGNLCLDTRCNYIDMSELWREANGHCLKDGGDTCWVAPVGDRCWAISSSDLAPAAIALGASVRLVGAGGDRLIALEDLYRNDGIDHLTKSSDE